MLEADVNICETGDTLTSAQANLLKLFEHQLAEFSLTLHAHWQQDGTFQEL